MLKTESIVETLDRVRVQTPLVHNITNYVVMNSTANALLAMGAAPTMAEAPEEMAEIVAIASSLVINIGTLGEKKIDAMLIAAKHARGKGKPIVLDPVGIGATSLRKKAVREIISTAVPSVIRGNASEILSIANQKSKAKGVDSLDDSGDAIGLARLLARELGCVISVSGETDYITDGETVHSVANGNKLMTKVTGMGCTATAITGACIAVNNNPLTAAASAMAIMGIAGEIAAEETRGPGTMQAVFLDSLYNLQASDIEKRYRSALGIKP